METIDLAEVGEYKLNLPAWFYVRTKDFGNPKKSAVWYKLVNPLSTARNLATRKKQKSVELERSGIDKPEIEKNDGANILPGTLELFDRFSAYDQKRLQKYLKKDKEDKFAINPVIQRGRPEQMPKNILFNKTFKGYDQPYLDLVDNVKRGRIIPKLTTDLKQKKTVFEDDEMPSETSSSASLIKTTSTENEKIYDALMDLLGDQEEVKSAMSAADIPTPSTAYMISRLPENRKKAKSVKSEVSFPSSVSSLSKSSKKSSKSSKSDSSTFTLSAVDDKLVEEFAYSQAKERGLAAGIDLETIVEMFPGWYKSLTKSDKSKLFKEMVIAAGVKYTGRPKTLKKDMSIEEAMKIVGLKNPNEPFGELEGETFPDMPRPRATKGATKPSERFFNPGNAPGRSLK